MDTLDRVIGRRLYELRKERDWKQSDVQDMARRFGIEWARSTVSEIESGKKRSDRLEVLAVLCSMFGVTLEQLLDGDQEIEMSRTWSLKELREGLRGELEPSSEVPGTQRIAGDNPVEVRRMAGKLGVTDDELRRLVQAVYGKWERPIRLRDELAGVEQDDISPSAQAKRGHATRRIMREIAEAIEREGIDALTERGEQREVERTREVIDRVGFPLPWEAD
ncbi:helix-turn-helix domain-containing protein [Corynebacterium glyciniphilum]|uniref:helix-turn-helix domain-containing protein n=1 Tax=Corynebacterium glyciniphilum TaxID=1404244 RepID=UPI0026556A1D|nr:helix-turn-helix transcriptional regulator [Corynebacterium glyciniphilum]MDN6706756.1 helix-turn-helix domain-containing protein [Corynebacterium glyciniphilum]